MPGVKRLFQESENSGKPEYIHGHMFGGLGILAGRAGSWACIPLRAYPKIIFLNGDGWHSFPNATDTTIFQTYFTLFLYFGIGSKYIKTCTPMRRFTTSHGATVRFMYKMSKEQKEGGTIHVVADTVSQRILNRSFMIDWQDRLYQDSVQVRLEDGKLNPKATFTALCAFLDLPYTETMTYCSLLGEKDPFSDLEGYAAGFDPSSVYKTYDDYVNDSERIYIEYFLRDAYEYYGYDFKYYDGGPMDMDRIRKLVSNFDKIDYYMRETWKKVYATTTVSKGGKPLPMELQAQA